MSLNQPPPTASAEELQEEIEFTQLLLATLDTDSDTYWPDKLEREQHIANLQSRLDTIRGSIPGPSYMSAQLSASRKRPRAFEDALAAEYFNKSSRTTPSPAVTPDTSSSNDSFPELFETRPAQPQAGGVRQAHSSLHSALGASARHATHQQLPRIPGMSRPSPHRLPSMQHSSFPRPLSSQSIKSEFSRGTPLRTPTQPPRGYSQNPPPKFAQPSASNEGVEIIDLCGSDSDSDVQEVLPLRNSNYNQGYGSSSAFMPRSMQQPNRFSMHRQPNPARTPAGQSIYNTLRGTMHDPLPVDDFDGMLDTIQSPWTFGEIQRGCSFMGDPLQSSSQHQNLLGYHAAAYGLGSMPGAWPTFTDPIHMLQREREWHDRYDGYGVQQGARSAEDTLKMLGNIGFDEEIPPEQRLTTPPAMAVQLMEHQKLGVSWMKKMEEGSNKGSILADEMGLGKTVQALSLIVSRPSEDPMRKTTLVVAPVALMRQWEREIKTKVKNSHALSVITYHGSKRKPFKELRQYDVVLTSFGTLTSEFGRKERIREFEARAVTDPEGAPARPKNEEYTLFGKDALWYRVILDEAHTIRNKETKASRACCELKTIYRLCMTGTPMMNRTDELYGLVRFLRIKPYCEWNEFRQDIKTSMEKGTPDIRQDGLRKLQALLKAILLRRTQESKIDGRVIFQLPPKTIIRDNVFFGEEQQEFYNALETKTQLKFNKYLKQGTVGKQYSQILVLLLRLRQACCHPHLLKDFAEPATDLPEEQMLDFARQLSNEVVARIKAEDGAFSCPICLDGVENPAIFLPCGHNACSECFARITSEPPRSDEGYKCPNCRGKLNPHEITDYNSFKKVHMSDTTLVNSLGKLVDDETIFSSDDESQSEDDDEEDDLDGFIARDEEVEGSASGFASERPKKSKKARGKEKKRDGAPKQKQTLAQLRRDAQKNILAKRRYFKRLCKDWITSAKVDKTMMLLRDIKDADPTEKTLVFSQFTSFLDILEVPMNREGFDYTRLDGTMSPDLRNDAVNQFIDSPTHNVMLISLKAGNAGLNLNAASQVIILDPFWNPYIEYQAIGRAHRLGQTRAVTVHRILVPKTVEDRIMDLQSRKEEMITKALDEDAGKNISRLGVKDLAYLFGVPMPNNS